MNNSWDGFESGRRDFREWAKEAYKEEIAALDKRNTPEPDIQETIPNQRLWEWLAIGLIALFVGTCIIAIF
jgi:hypothetical protein